MSEEVNDPQSKMPQLDVPQINVPLTGLEREFLEAVAVRIAELRENGMAVVTDRDSPEKLAEEVLSASPARSRLADDTGPFYDLSSLMDWLALTREALDARTLEGTLLACTTSDGRTVFPAWQFDEHGAVLEGIEDVIGMFRGVGLGDEWTIARWLNVPHPDLGNETRLPASCRRNCEAGYRGRTTRCRGTGPLTGPSCCSRTE